jgi:hypothetical protein
MRVCPAPFDHVLLRGGVVVAVAALIGACNAVLGVEDVALDCHVNSDYPLVSSSAMQATLVQFTDGDFDGPELRVQLETAADVEMVVRLYDDFPPHGVVNAPGTYQLVMSDAAYKTCGICVAIYSDFPTPTGTESWTYRAFGQGSMTLTVANNARLSGSLHDLKLRHVMPNENPIDVDLDDGCSVSVEDVEFDVPYSF